MTAVRRRYVLIGLLAFGSLWPISFDARIVLWCLCAYVWLGT